jgi:hypothetical protein
MYFSRFFKNYIPRKGHLVKGRQGVAGEIMDLRGDIDSTFLNYEHEGNLVKHNNTATTDPGPTDDNTKGYAVLSVESMSPRRSMSGGGALRVFVSTDPMDASIKTVYCKAAFGRSLARAR